MHCVQNRTSGKIVVTKVVAVNGSPEMENGNTVVVLGTFLDGMKEAGAAVELFYAKSLEIKDCARASILEALERLASSVYTKCTLLTQSQSFSKLVEAYYFFNRLPLSWLWLLCGISK
jgi:hypothetical protein